MEITKEQQEILDSLTIERLSSKKENLQLVGDFCNCKNESLAHTLQNEAYQEDENGDVAYYLVKSPQGNILFYFSLKCGLLYDNIKYTENLRKINDLYKSLIELNNDSDTSPEDKQIIKYIIESLRARKGLIKKDLAQISYIKKNEIIKELEKESEDDLKRVGNTFAGIEVVHFCANDNCREEWKQYGIHQKLGVVVFWYFVIPRILEAMKHVGCQYIFLFAADTTEDELLVNYYKTYLGFEDSKEHSTAISWYDYGCKFMHQKTSALKEKRENFFNHFNPDDDMV